MIKRALSAVLCGWLTGCAGHPLDCATGLVAWNDCAPGTAGYQRLANNEMADVSRCSSYGFTLNTPAFAQCRMNLAMQRDSANDALLRSVVGANLAKSAVPPAPAYQMPISQPVVTNCTPLGNSVNCITH